MKLGPSWVGENRSIKKEYNKTQSQNKNFDLGLL